MDANASRLPQEIKYGYHSLEDFLIANLLTVDGVADDGGSARYPVKGREIEAAILFADITQFSSRTVDPRSDGDARLRKPLLHLDYR